ncbi:MAG: hypothetical protein JNK64_19490 [Myxococcales bacterium]|nr:hypothetical protein [Myxococcales bacterium]
MQPIELPLFPLHQGHARDREDLRLLFELTAVVATCGAVAGALLGSAALLRREFFTSVPLVVAAATLAAAVLGFRWLGRRLAARSAETPLARVLRVRPHDVVAVGHVVRHVAYATYGGPRSGDEYAVRIVLSDGAQLEAGDTALGTVAAVIREALARRGVALTRQGELFPRGTVRA